jgi:hypothetical protein
MSIQVLLRILLVFRCIVLVSSQHMVIIDKVMGWDFYRKGVNGCQWLGLIGRK